MRSSFASLIFAVVLLLTFHDAGRSQVKSPTKSDLLLEVTSTSCFKDCESASTRVYTNGKFVRETKGSELAKSGRQRSVSMTEEKVLEPEEISELISWAERADFLDAEPEYVVPTIDGREEITIVYRNNGKEKTIRLANFSRGDAAQKARVPATVLKLARWAHPNDFTQK